MKTSGMPGAMALALAALIYAWLLSSVRRVEAAEPRWFTGYARDGVSLFGFLSFSAAFAFAGLPGPLACLAGASLTLAGYGLEHLLAATLPPPRAMAILHVLLVGLAAAAGAFREPLARGLRALVRELF